MVYATNCQRIFINDYLEKEDELIFILTCGGSLGTGDLTIEKLINPARSKVYELPIKTNYIIFHEMDDEKTIKSKLKKADESLLKIIDDFEIGFLKNEKIKIVIHQENIQEEKLTKDLIEKYIVSIVVRGNEIL